MIIISRILLFELLFLFCAFSCDQKERKNDFIVTGKLLEQDTLEVGGNFFKIDKFDSGITTLFDADNKFVYIDSNYVNSWILEDFNADGKPDIRLKYLTNVPGVDEMLLYDSLSKSFQLVDNFSSFPSSLPVPGVAGLYYSYSRAGCADSDWISKLYVIEDFSCVEKGIIKGRGCKSEQNQTGIFSFKVIDSKINPVDTFLRDPGYFPNKWNFIEEYWSTKGHSFVER